MRTRFMRPAFSCLILSTFIFAAQSLAAQAAAAMPWDAQAETCKIDGGGVMKKRPGYTGSGYVNLPIGEPELSWTVVIPKSKMYTIVLRAAGVGKTGGDIYVNGEKGEKFKFDGDGKFIDIEVPNNFLDEGEVTIGVRAKFSPLDIDSVGLRDGLKILSGPVKSEPSNPASSPEVRKVMSFLASEYGKHIVSGQQDMTWRDSTSMIDKVYAMTGKYPALQGFDFLNYCGAMDGSNGLSQTEEAIAWWKRGGLAAFCWHWRAGPSKEFYANRTGFRIDLDPKSDGYKSMIADIDVIAKELKKLEAAKVPVLWRPLHEASGAWFWWGASGAVAYKGLWNLMYDRLVKFHGIKNLIWVWNGQGEDWYPGDETVDVIGWDLYGGDRMYYSWKDTWLRAQGCVKGSQAKLVALSENGVIPDPDKMIQESVPWSWFMTWNDGNGEKEADDFFSNDKIQEKDYKVKVFNHPYVLTLDELPSFRDETAGTTDSPPEPKSAIKDEILNAAEKSWADFIDFSEYVSDKEDGNKLSFAIAEQSNPGVLELKLSKDGKLSARAKGTGATTLTVKAIDSVGNEAKLSVNIVVYDPDRGNVAFMKPARESSIDNPEDLAKYVNDGNLKTRWSSAFRDNEWIVIDLEGTFKIDRAVLLWEAAYGKEYEILGSTDNANWTLLARKTDGRGGKDELSFTPATVRYVKLLGKVRGTQWGFSPWEFEIWGERIK